MKEGRVADWVAAVECAARRWWSRARPPPRRRVLAVAAAAAMQALAEQGIHADRDGLHVMNPEVLSNATSMQEECKEFLSKTKQFNDIVGDFIEVMEGKSKIIEAEKLKAIGLGNKVEHEKEVRKRKAVRILFQGSQDAQKYRRPARALQLTGRLCMRHVFAAGGAGRDQREKGGARAAQHPVRVAAACGGRAKGADREADEQRGVSEAAQGRIVQDMYTSRLRAHLHSARSRPGRTRGCSRGRSSHRRASRADTVNQA